MSKPISSDKDLMGYEDTGHFRRKYPRRSLRKQVGALFDGHYFVCLSGEIGEGGMSIVSEYALSDGRDVVLSFQIPHGTFVTLRGTIKTVFTKDGLVVHGVAFDQIPLAFKRQIRAFVSARTVAT